MKFRRSKTGLAICSVYLGLYWLSGIYAVGVLLFTRPTPEFNPPSLVALPWTFILIPLSHSMGISDLYERLASSPFLYGALMWLVLLPAALLNAIILYLAGRFLDPPDKA
ncbi:MAG TPA: hypothetical protein VL523_14775 [Terriglobia bacterium]|nr:hypothetical protein [Terriglobia bacterium]